MNEDIKVGIDIDFDMVGTVETKWICMYTCDPWLKIDCQRNCGNGLQTKDGYEEGQEELGKMKLIMPWLSELLYIHVWQGGCER